MSQGNCPICGTWVDFGNPYNQHHCVPRVWGIQALPQGWRCPNCGSAHAPDVKTCPNGPMQTTLTTYGPATSVGSTNDAAAERPA